jgi:hypothetical protein
MFPSVAQRSTKIAQAKPEESQTTTKDRQRHGMSSHIRAIVKGIANGSSDQSRKEHKGKHGYSSLELLCTSHSWNSPTISHSHSHTQSETGKDSLGCLSSVSLFNSFSLSLICSSIKHSSLACVHVISLGGSKKKIDMNSYLRNHIHMIEVLTFSFPSNPVRLSSSGKLVVVLQICPNEIFKFSFNQFVGYIEKRIMIVHVITFVCSFT